MTTQVGATPALLSLKYASAWEQDSVLTRLPSHFNHSTTCLLQDEQEAKQHKGLDTDDYNPNENGAIISALSTTISDPSDPSLSGAIQATISNSPTSSSWESGHARKLFATCSANYGATECVKAIVMDCIELLESVNRKGKNWKKVVESGVWSMETCPYSESVMLTLRLQSVYLALPLAQFVFNMTGDLRTRWTWKRCLISAIEGMNNIGFDYYSNYRTLARWHRNLAKHRLYFCKTPDAKTIIPPFLCDNPDALEAFKRYGIANMQDL